MIKSGRLHWESHTTCLRKARNTVDNKAFDGEITHKNAT
jgi:hypothetical protein